MAVEFSKLSVASKDFCGKQTQPTDVGQIALKHANENSKVLYKLEKACNDSLNKKISSFFSDNQAHGALVSFPQTTYSIQQER